MSFLGVCRVLRRFLLLLSLLTCHFKVQAEVIAVAPLEKGFFSSSAPSLTMYWPGKNARAVLVMIPGGSGYMGLKPGQPDVKNPFYQMLKSLTTPELTSGRWDVVLLDSPAPLSPNQAYPLARATSDHLTRIESAVLFYQKKTGLPVWLMGHSNGGISLTEFVKYIQKEQKPGLISGIIASGIRNESYFNPPMDLPMLFVHHKEDGCAQTTPHRALGNNEKVQAFNQSVTEFAWITGGHSEPKDPCRSGHHMYAGASEESAKVIDDFMSRIYK